MVNVNVQKLVTIKNYEAGVGGNLLVVAEDNVTPVSIIGHKGVPKDIAVLLCTAKIKDKVLQDELADYTDESTPCNRVIVVSKKFLKLSNKKQLALLQIENSRAKTDPNTNIDGVIAGEVDAIEKFGKWTTYRAVTKARKVRERSTKKATRWIHHDYKKDCKVAEKTENAAKNVTTAQAEEAAANA